MTSTLSITLMQGKKSVIRFYFKDSYIFHFIGSFSGGEKGGIAGSIMSVISN
jgi:hypothetical protein